MPATMQIGIKRTGIPWHRRRRLRVERIGLPVVDIATGERGAGTLGAERIARGMAGAAMRQALDQIGAPIPFPAFRIFWLVGAAIQENKFPAHHPPPPLNPERNLVSTPSGPHH